MVPIAGDPRPGNPSMMSFCAAGKAMRNKLAYNRPMDGVIPSDGVSVVNYVQVITASLWREISVGTWRGARLVSPV